jgi:hypothetical protein
MTLVQFGDPLRFEFALEFFSRANVAHFGLTAEASSHEISVNNPVLARLFTRLAAGEPVVLPYLKGNLHSWFLTATDKHDLDRLLLRTSRFIVPTYAEFGNQQTSDSTTPSKGVPQWKPFDPTTNKLQQLGSTLYPGGYYTWRSPAQFLDSILDHLNLWLDLEENQPVLPLEQHPSYSDLHQVFNTALAARNWPEAEEVLGEIRRLNLSTADNIAFLQIQLLAQQGSWADLWARPDFSDLAKLRMPRAVRAALLTAFHYSVLLPLEEQNDWVAAMDAFKAARSRLGLLLTGRFGLTQPPVLAIFGYQAAIARDRLLWTELRTVTEDPHVQRVLAALEAWLPPPQVVPEITLSPVQQVRYALAESDYDRAHDLAVVIADLNTRMRLLLEIAFHSGDSGLAEEALYAYWELSDEIQTVIRESDAHVGQYIQFLEIITQPSIPIKAVEVPVDEAEFITDWPEWWTRASSQVDSPELPLALERLATVGDAYSWTSAQLDTLNDQLLAVTTDAYLLSRPLIRKAFRQLTSLFLEDQEFPRDDDHYRTLYENLYLGWLEQKEINLSNGLILLRLVDALLQHNPTRSTALFQHIAEWLQTPIPALESVVLDALELFGEYGIASSLLAKWYRTWVSYLLTLPTHRDTLSLTSWLMFGNWIQPGEDLLRALERALETATAQSPHDLVSTLPVDYRIAIFSFDAAGAKRASDLLLMRNAHMKIDICTEKDLNEVAKTLARNANLVVIVTTCISHALTYGIRPYLATDPVYPISRGSTSIVRAIEDHLRKLS